MHFSNTVICIRPVRQIRFHRDPTRNNNTRTLQNTSLLPALIKDAYFAVSKTCFFFMNIRVFSKRAFTKTCFQKVKHVYS